MTRKISRARAVADQSQMMEALQKSYLESVLEHINSGVITIDAAEVIKQSNRAAEIIFGLEQGGLNVQTIDHLVKTHPPLKRFFEVVIRNIQNHQEWQDEIIIFGHSGRKVLRVRGTELEQKFQEIREQVIVIDDLTELIQAQKNSAWSEMARRLAHEIKNPLTPIQLSAERLQGKLAGQVDKDKQKMLDRYTHTIVQQVEAMKQMVNNFADFARAPDPSLQNMDLNQIIREVQELYIENRNNIEIKLHLDKMMPEIQADPVRLRQLIHNLMKNATEAMNGKGWISLTTQCVEEYGCHYVELIVEDSGRGISEGMMETLFEPYVTGKNSGSGLGLAIVKKIVDEHSGLVWAENSESGGARFILRLPVLLNRDSLVSG
jgi:PAS domain S-box-containing protein